MFHCVTMLNFFVSKQFLLKIFVAETNKNQTDLNFLFCFSNKKAMLQVRSMRNLTCLRTVGRIFETLFLLSNEIHYMKVQNKPKHSLQDGG